MATEVVELKNGSKEDKRIVVVIMVSLRNLIKTHPIALCELIMKCKDANHQFFGNTGEVLQGLCLVQIDGSVNTSVSDIVLSAVEGDGLDMTLSSPIK